MMRNAVGRDELAGGSILRSRTVEESQEAWDALARLFREIEEWHASVASTLPIQPNSALGIASELSEPFQAGHSVSYLRLTAVDHLHALRALIQEAQAQHIFAPFSLIRSALESASTALWILGDPNPRTIAVRSLRHEWGNLRELENAYRTIGAPEEEVATRREVFDQILEKNRMKKDGIKANPPGTLKILQAASETHQLGTMPALIWQMCSGATHGRNWVTGFLTMMEGHDDGISKVISGRLTSDEQAIVLAGYVTCDVVRCLFDVQKVRSRPQGHKGAAFKKAAPKLLLPSPGLYLPQSGF